MSEFNKKTIQAYENHIDDYFADTPAEVTDAYREWFGRGFDGMPTTAKIFEIGSATGRDAEYLESLGYKIQRSDVAEGFVDRLKSSGYDAMQFNLITDEFPYKCDVIFANAVLPHLTRQEAIEAIHKIFVALNENGRFIFDLKEGDSASDGMRDAGIGAERYFSYWNEDEIRDALSEFSDVQIIKIPGKRMSRLAIVAKK